MFYIKLYFGNKGNFFKKSYTNIIQTFSFTNFLKSNENHANLFVTKSVSSVVASLKVKLNHG